jgi:hypothetical protein
VSDLVGLSSLVTGLFGALWLTAATTKFVARDELGFQVAALSGRPRAPQFIPLGLVVGEGALGLAAIQPVFIVGNVVLLVSGLLLLAFAVAMGWSRRIASNVECGCFGFLVDAKNSRQHIFLNAAGGVLSVGLGLGLSIAGVTPAYETTLSAFLLGLAALVLILVVAPMVQTLRRTEA